MMAGLARLAIALAALACAPLAHAGETHVAVAANFTEPARALAAAFERQTGHRAVLSFGSSGVLYAQISQGAPFEVFLSADAERPVKAVAEKLAVRSSRFTYATGRLVLWSADPRLVDAQGQVLRRGSFARLAIADPALAPYGLAAMQTIARLGLTARLTPRLVKGASIAQTYQFVSTGAAELGFVAQSQVIAVRGGSRWLVPARLHAPIAQQAVLLTRGARDPAAIAFLRYLRTPAARAIIRRYGYAA